MAKKNTLAWRIKDLRKHKGLTQKQLASELGISYNSVIDYENGRREPNAKALVRLEQFFGVSGEYLRGEIDKEIFMRQSEEIQSGLDVVLKQLDRFMSAYRIASQADQLRATDLFQRLLTHMINSAVTDSSDPDWTAEEIDHLIGVFLALNRAGRDKLLERADELQEMPRYHRE